MEPPYVVCYGTKLGSGNENRADRGFSDMVIMSRVIPRLWNGYESRGQALAWRPWLEEMVRQIWLSTYTRGDRLTAVTPK